jgi:hypothetical protein
MSISPSIYREFYVFAFTSSPSANFKRLDLIEAFTDPSRAFTPRPAKRRDAVIDHGGDIAGDTFPATTSQMPPSASMIGSALNRFQKNEFCTALRISQPILISHLSVNNFLWGTSC